MISERRTRPDDEAVSVDLPADLTAAREARAQARAALGHWRLPALLDPVVLAVSELVGNAVRHGRPPVWMRLRRSGRTVCVEVHDEATTPGRTSGLPGEDAESGRGTYIVTALASDTGVRSIDGDGKVVWAEFEQPDRRGPGGQEPDDQG